MGDFLPGPLHFSAVMMQEWLILLFTILTPCVAITENMQSPTLHNNQYTDRARLILSARYGRSLSFPEDMTFNRGHGWVGMVLLIAASWWRNRSHAIFTIDGPQTVSPKTAHKSLGHPILWWDPIWDSSLFILCWLFPSATYIVKKNLVFMFIQK